MSNEAADVTFKRRLGYQFSTVPTELIIDSSLSCEARWTMIYLLSRPDGWIVQLKDIQNVGGFGRDKARSIIKELISNGWISREYTRTETGEFAKVEYLIEDPEMVLNKLTPRPQTENPLTDYPSTENPPLTYEGGLSKTDIKTEGNARARAASSKRGSRVPQDFQPDATSLKRALEEGIEKADIHRAVSFFVDYWSGRGDTRIDWQATFRNSLSILSKQVRRTPNGYPQQQARPEPGERLTKIFDNINREIAERFGRRTEDDAGEPRGREHPARISFNGR